MRQANRVAVDRLTATANELECDVFAVRRDEHCAVIAVIPELATSDRRIREARLVVSSADTENEVRNPVPKNSLIGVIEAGQDRRGSPCREWPAHVTRSVYSVDG